jgi:hypothetical protein
MTLSKRSLADLTATAARQAERVSKATREEAETRCTAILRVGEWRYVLKQGGEAANIYFRSSDMRRLGSMANACELPE